MKGEILLFEELDFPIFQNRMYDSQEERGIKHE